MSVLHRIAEQVLFRIEEDKADPERMAELGRAPARRPRDFRQAFLEAGARPHVIAEVKLASPSEGDIALGADPVAVAGDYLRAGARAISVLTERDFFKGSPDYLRAIRRAHPEALLLMKDFVVDEHQLDCAVHDGADAVLLIVALLESLQAGLTRAFLLRALGLGLTPLVEVHEEREMQVAVECGARLIGVNNRNLKTLEVSLETSERLAALAPPGATLIAESGLRTPQDLRRLGGVGYRGFLIGTSFMKSGKPGVALAELLKGTGAG